VRGFTDHIHFDKSELRKGYSRAARLSDKLEEKGVIGPAVSSKPSEVLESNSPQDRQEHCFKHSGNITYKAMTEEEFQNGEFTITFRNGALKRLKKVAADLGIPEDRLGEVLTKGVSLIDVGKEGHNITIKKGHEEYLIDLRRL
jgi:hypothetical protein